MKSQLLMLLDQPNLLPQTLGWNQEVLEDGNGDGFVALYNVTPENGCQQSLSVKPQFFFQ